jgi:hypothetical protein
MLATADGHRGCPEPAAEAPSYDARDGQWCGAPSSSGPMRAIRPTASFVVAATLTASHSLWSFAGLLVFGA